MRSLLAYVLFFVIKNTTTSTRHIIYLTLVQFLVNKVKSFFFYNKTFRDFKIKKLSRPKSNNVSIQSLVRDN